MRISDWSSDVCSSDLPRSDVAIIVARWEHSQNTCETVAANVTATPHRQLLGRNVACCDLSVEILDDLRSCSTTALILLRVHTNKHEFLEWHCTRLQRLTALATQHLRRDELSTHRKASDCMSASWSNKALIMG